MSKSDSQLPQDERKQIAIDEWKLLQAVIGRLEDNEIKIRSWLLTIVTGVAVAAFAKPSAIWCVLVLGAGILISCVFLTIELMQRVPKKFAIRRAAKVEAFIRANATNYDGPRISISLKRRKAPFNEYFTEFRTEPVLFFYGAIWIGGLLAIIIGVINSLMLFSPVTILGWAQTAVDYEVTGMSSIFTAYLITFGWAIVGSLSMGIGIIITLKLFDFSTRDVDEWELVKQGNIPIAIILAAVIIALGLVVSSAIHP